MVTRNGRDPPGWWNWKAYIADYITLIVLAIITALVYVLAKPATRTLVPTDPAINFPNKPAQVPDAMLIPYAAAVPFVMLCVAQILVRSKHDFHNAILGLAMTAVLILFNFELLKDFFGEYRPDFMSRCNWNETTQECTGEPGDIDEGRKAFPSGHSGFSLGMYIYLVLYLVGRTRPLRNGLILILVLCNGVLLLGTWIAATRIIDNKHNLVDITAGAFFGTVIATTVYLLYFETPWGQHAGRPRIRSSNNIFKACTSPEDEAIELANIQLPSNSVLSKTDVV